MALFGFLKKKEKDVELPPPPSPPERMMEIPSELEIPPIKAGMPFELPKREYEKEEIKPEYEKEEIKPEYEKFEFPEIPEYEKEEEFETAPPEEEAGKESFPTREDVFAPKQVKSMFVAVDEYKNLASNTKVIRARLMEAENHVARLSDLKNQKEKVFDRLRGLLEDAEKKISYTDAVIEKAQG